MTVVTIFSCSNRLTQKLNQSIFLFKDKDGLYQYEPTTGREIIIFKATDKQVFLDEPFQLSNDTLTFGFKGELTHVYTSEYTSTEKYYKDYFSVDLKSRKNWLSKKIRYKIKEQSLNIKTLLVDNNGKTSVLADTSMVFHSSNTTSKGIIYNDLSPRFFSNHSLGDKSVFSLCGKIYYTEKSDTTLLVDYKGDFDPKFGSGYFQPRLDPKGQYAIFEYLPGFLNFKDNASLQKVNIRTKKIEILKTGDFGEPSFSADGNFVLFKRDQKQGKLNTWISKIYILDLTTLHVQKISDAYSAQWKQ